MWHIEQLISQLFLLHLDTQYFRIVRKFYPFHPVVCNVKTLKMLVISPLTHFYNFSVITADPNMKFYRQVGRDFVQISIYLSIYLAKLSVGKLFRWWCVLYCRFSHVHATTIFNFPWNRYPGKIQCI